MTTSLLLFFNTADQVWSQRLDFTFQKRCSDIASFLNNSLRADIQVRKAFGSTERQLPETCFTRYLLIRIRLYVSKHTSMILLQHRNTKFQHKRNGIDLLKSSPPHRSNQTNSLIQADSLSACAYVNCTVQTRHGYQHLTLSLRGTLAKLADHDGIAMSSPVHLPHRCETSGGRSYSGSHYQITTKTRQHAITCFVDLSN